MDAAGLNQARDRLRRARIAIDHLSAAGCFEEAEDAWRDFLLSSAGVYSKLESASKRDNQSRLWFNKKKEERRTDPVLRYLHHARNSDEHTTERVLSRYADTGPIWGQKPRFGQRIPVQIQQLDPLTNEPIGTATEGFYSGSTIKLTNVKDRGVVYDIPQSHLGKMIPFFEEPRDIALLALTYLEALVAEAETIISSSSNA